MLHLIRLQASPATEPRRGWKQTISRERAEIIELIADSPSLHPMVPAMIEREISLARSLAREDMALYEELPTTDPAELSCTAEQVIGSWLPE